MSQHFCNVSFSRLLYLAKLAAAIAPPRIDGQKAKKDAAAPF